jgi:hypothetical protein
MHRTSLCAALVLFVLPAIALAQDAAQTSPEQKEARQKVRTACAADIQKFCANIERAKGAMRTCLDQHQASLSSDCNAARAERAAVRAKDKG